MSYNPENRVMIQVDAEQVLLLCAAIGQLAPAADQLAKIIDQVGDGREWLFPLAENRLRVTSPAARQELIAAANDFKPSDDAGWRLVAAVGAFLSESDNT